MKQPKISILVPTYNYAQFLPEAIESVLEQDYQDYEIIIVDDGSPDNTSEVVAPYCAKDPRIRFEVNPVNLGMVANWNYCLKQAKGEYVKFVFGDDKLADSRTLSKMVSVLDEDPSVALVASARKVIDEESRWNETWDVFGKSGKYEGKKAILKCLIRDQNLIGEPSVVLFRRALAHRGFNPRYCQIVDLEMWFHLLEQGNLAYTNELLCCFRRHSQQQTCLNSVTGLGLHEWIVLLQECQGKKWLWKIITNEDRRAIAYRISLAERTPENQSLEKRYLGNIERWKRVMWKMIRPFQKISRSCRKRHFYVKTLFSKFVLK